MAKSNLRLVTPDSELRTVALKGSFRVNVLLSIESTAVRIARAQRKQHASNQNPPIKNFAFFVMLGCRIRSYPFDWMAVGVAATRVR
jgi:hypothetical protein